MILIFGFYPVEDKLQIIGLRKQNMSDYDKFNKLFDEDLGVQQHNDHGGAILKYNPDFKYPIK